jgi:hypothetical protein
MSKSESPKANKAPKASNTNDSIPTKTDGGIPILRFGSKTNFANFRRVLISVCGERYGISARFIETGTMPTIPPIPHPRASIAPAAWTALQDYERDAITFDYNDKVKTRNRQQTSIEVDQEKIFSLIYGALSVESTEKVETDPDWKDINDKKDALRLWKRIEATHQAGGVTSITEWSMHLSLEALMRIKQGATENLSTFKRRFDESLAHAKATCTLANGQIITSFPLAFQIVCYYLSALDSARYATLTLAIHTDAQKGILPFPRALNDVHQLAVDHKVLTTNGTLIEAVAFRVNISEGKHAKSGDKGTNAGGKGNKPTSANKSHAKDTPSGRKLPPNPCKFCGGPHWNSDCDMKPAADSPPKSVHTTDKQINATLGTVNVNGIVLSSRAVPDSDITGVCLDSGLPIETYIYYIY